MEKNTDNNVVNQYFYDVDDVIARTGVSRPKAYSIMREINMELASKGYITISGKVSAKYFDEKLHII